MSDILSGVLKVNQSVNSGADNNSVRNNPIVPNDTQIQNIVDPSKVVRPDSKGQTEDQPFQFGYDSNYGSFIQALREMPQLTEVFSKLLFTDVQNILTSGVGENTAAEIAGFMEMIKMDPDQLLGFMKSQESNASQFGGVFFKALREVLNSTNSVPLRAQILDFLKNYSNMASGPHLLNNIQNAIKEILPNLFKADGEQLQEIASHLVLPQEGEKPTLDSMNANVYQNSKVLKEELIPFFAKYVNRTHDLGRPRELMTLITLNTARYCGGTKENVIQSFVKLLKFGDFKSKLGELKEDNLELILNKLMAERKEVKDDIWTEKFMSMLKAGLDSSEGHETRAVFQNVLNAMLLNESVYMPLLHLMMPVNLNGNIMFSEMWIDPDAQGEGTAAGEEERNIRLLVKFDIKDLGFFDLVMNYQSGNVGLLVTYPPKLEEMEKQIRAGLNQIVEDNGLSLQSFTLEQGRKPLQLTDVFPKIKEGKNAINVKI